MKTPASGVRKDFLIKLLTLNYSDFLPEEPKNPQSSQLWSEMVNCGWESFSSPDLISQSKRAWLMPGTEKTWHVVEKELSKQDEMGDHHSSWGLVARPSMRGVGGQRSAGVGKYSRNFSADRPCHFCSLESLGAWGWAPSWSQDTDVIGSVVGSYHHLFYLVQCQFSFDLWTIKHGLR